MHSLSAAVRLLSLAALLGGTTAATAQHYKPVATAPAVVGAKGSSTNPTKPHSPVVTESLSGLDLIPNRKTGSFGIRINHRISQPATLRLIDTKTSVFVVNEMLTPSPAPTRAVQVGRLATGEYKMEVVMTDTTYWKTVRVSR